MRFLLVSLLVLGLGTPVLANPQGLRVNGQGVVESAPDMAVITIGASHQAGTARDAMAQVSKATTSILKQLEKLGVAPADMQTSDLSLSPVWDRNNNGGSSQRVVGYVASNQLRVQVKDLQGLGEILDAVVQGGSNRMGGLQFALIDPRPAKDEARRLAVADARAKAELYAQAAGVKLGAVLSLTEQGPVSARPEMMRAMADAGSSVPIAEGELATTAMVEIVFEIIN